LDIGDPLALVFRWMHILAAITAVGGAIFARFALLPAAAELPDAQRATLVEGVRSRWFMFVNAAILFLIVSGLYNLVMMFKQFKLPPAYHALLLVKILLALGIFFIASVLNGRSANAQRFRANARFWLNINVTMAVVLVLISGTMRALPHTPKTEAVAETSTTP
jgi:uncharacterized membrane protein